MEQGEVQPRIAPPLSEAFQLPHNKNREKNARKQTANAVRFLAKHDINLCPYEHYPNDSQVFL